MPTLGFVGRVLIAMAITQRQIQIILPNFATRSKFNSLMKMYVPVDILSPSLITDMAVGVC